MAYGDHDFTTRQSRGKRGGYNVVCQDCSWRSGPYRTEEEAWSYGNRHKEAVHRAAQNALQTEK
jgi:hypothetical protein